MPTQTTTIEIEAEFNIMKMSVHAMVNMVLQVLTRIVQKRGLPTEYLVQRNQIIENGIRTWLIEEKLSCLALEVALPGGEEAAERWDMEIGYSASPREEVRKPAIDQIEAFSRALRALPAGATYRIIASLEPDASAVPGWSHTAPLPLTVAQEQEIGDWGFGHHGARLRYMGGTW